MGRSKENVIAFEKNCKQKSRSCREHLFCILYNKDYMMFRCIKKSFTKSLQFSLTKI